MKACSKLILPLIFTLAVSSNAQAFSEEGEIKKTIETFDSSLISEWGDSALLFNALDKDYDLEALGFPTTNQSVSSLNITSVNEPITHQRDIFFENKAFIAESGFSNKSVNQTDEPSFFIQGSYKVLQQEKFTLVLTAKIESLNEHSIYQFYSNDFVSHQIPTTKVNSSKSYARFGILGQYSISNHWYLTGGLTSTAHETSSNSPLIHNTKKEQVALFGTTYTF